MELLSINTIAFELVGYKMSYVELFGTLSGLASVYYAARNNVMTWSSGIINTILFFILFYQVQLYSDMFLQVYFLVISIYGWVFWSKPTNASITYLTKPSLIRICALTAIAGVVVGIFMTKIHTLLPTIFTQPAAYPFADAQVMVFSMVAVVLLAKRKVDSWYLWVAVDVVSTILFAMKGVYLVSAEYFVFLCIAISGLISWRKL